MTNSNESDTTGVFGTNWSIKVTAGIPAAIRSDNYFYSTYRFRTALYAGYDKVNDRATDFVWLDYGDRGTPSYVNGWGAANRSYIIYGRRDDRETVASTQAVGTYSSDAS